ncbi:MAG: hypothetical protein MHM6MM_004542 [Cercozoa sp. M6MM]
MSVCPYCEAALDALSESSRKEHMMDCMDSLACVEGKAAREKVVKLSRARVEQSILLRESLDKPWRETYECIFCRKRLSKFPLDRRAEHLLLCGLKKGKRTIGDLLTATCGREVIVLSDDSDVEDGAQAAPAAQDPVTDDKAASDEFRELLRRQWSVWESQRLAQSSHDIWESRRKRRRLAAVTDQSDFGDLATELRYLCRKKEQEIAKHQQELQILRMQLRRAMNEASLSSSPSMVSPILPRRQPRVVGNGKLKIQRLQLETKCEISPELRPVVKRDVALDFSFDSNFDVSFVHEQHGGNETKAPAHAGSDTVEKKNPATVADKTETTAANDASAVKASSTVSNAAIETTVAEALAVEVKTTCADTDENRPMNPEASSRLPSSLVHKLVSSNGSNSRAAVSTTPSRWVLARLDTRAQRHLRRRHAADMAAVAPTSTAEAFSHAQAEAESAQMTKMTVVATQAVSTSPFGRNNIALS